MWEIGNARRRPGDVPRGWHIGFQHEKKARGIAPAGLLTFLAGGDQNSVRSRAP